MTRPVPAIEQILASQLQRRLDEADRGEGFTAAMAAARGVLNEDELSVAEHELLAESALEEGADALAVILARRMERALQAGISAAGLGDDPRRHTDVVVLRRPSDSDRETQNKQLAGALSSLREHLATRMRGGEGRLLLVAARQLYGKVKNLVPSGKVGGLPSVDFQDGGPRDAHTSAAIEVISADVSLAQLERRATATFEELRSASLAGDEMRAAWLAAATPSIDSDSVEPDSAEPEPAAAEVPAQVPPGAEGPAADDDPLIGQLFHLKYRIVRRIGKGGFGSVYEAADERGAGNRVAIKILSGRAAESAAQQQSFKDEARRVTRLSHPNVVDWKVFDETEAGLPYFVMELVQGEEFEETLRRERRIEPMRAARLLLQVLDALRAAHHLSEREAILHLDLKPSNLFRIPALHGREEQIKVIDFGIGQYIGDEQVEDERVVPAEGLAPGDIDGPSTLTFSRPPGGSSTASGVNRSKGCTPEYASPEQCDHVMYMEDIVALDGRSDLYSLGVVAFEMLTGQLPFKSKSRLDVLRMHREDPAPKVGSMGFKVPRKLARFVDRCLQKDRDARWKDTNAAYEYLHDIVHPPVWKTVAKVTVPIVVAGVMIGSWAWATREVAIPSVSLVDEGGAALDELALHLGPARPSARLQLAGAEGSSSTGTWRIQRLSDGEAASGWSVAQDTPGFVAITGPAGLEGRSEERVELRLDGDRMRSRPLQLVWIGPESWDVAGVQIANRPLDELAGMRVDPYGAALDLWIEGAGSADIEQVSARVGEAPPLNLSVGASVDDRSRYRLELGDAGLVEGENALELRVLDAAGREWSRALELDAVAGLASLERLALVDGAGERAEDGELPEANRILEAFLVTPRTSAVLRVELARTADVEWSVTVEGEPEPALRGRAREKSSYELALEGLADLRGGDPYRGRIELAVDERPYVLHAAGSGRGALTKSIAFSFEDSLPTFAAEWRTPVRSRTLNADTEVLYTNAAAAELVVTRRQAVPMRVELLWWPKARPDATRRATSEALLNLQAQQVPLKVELEGAGEHVLVVRAFRFDTAAGTTGERADVEQTYRVVLDERAPRMRVVGLAPGHVVRSRDSVPESPGVRFVELDDGSIEPAVDLDWTLLRVSEGEKVASRGSVSDHDPRGGDAAVALAAYLASPDTADGDYRLEVSGRDRAGNELEPASVDFVVARRGPTLTLEEPTGVGKWHRDPASRRWVVRVRAADPNGVGEHRCELVAGDVRTLVPLSAEVGSTARRQVLVGDIALPHTLSETHVRLAFTASDAYGARASWTSDELELPTITLPAPERVAVRFGSRPVESMCLVRGNDDFEYLFGGRGDELENPAFAQAGLGAFNDSPRRTRSRSWQVPLSAGAVGDYYLDMREVSVEQFLAFLLDSSGYVSAAHWPAPLAPDEAERLALVATLEALPGDRPATGVNWGEAFAYAAWVGKRLPTWAEWEYALRGGAEYRPCEQASDEQLVANLGSEVAEWTSTAFVGAAEERRYPQLWSLADPARLVTPAVELELGEAQELWVVGGQGEAERNDFSVADNCAALTRRPTVGFRCAISARALQGRIGQETPDGPAFLEQP